MPRLLLALLAIAVVLTAPPPADAAVDVDTRAGRRAVAVRHDGGVRVELYSLRTGRRLFRWTDPAAESANVAVDRRGRLAWAVSSGILRVRGLDGRVTIRGQGAMNLRLEDGRTLVFGEDPYRALDLDPPPLRDGCPARSAFRPVLIQDGVQVTQAEYIARGRFDLQEVVLRACVQGSGRDRVIALTGSGMSDGVRLDGVAIVAPFVVLARHTWTKYWTVGTTVAAVDARTGAETRLDLGLAITGLRADGRTVHWVRDGVARSATL
jgi:hypothetical protein